MHINANNDDQISLTLKEISLLLTLAEGPSNGYQITKTYSLDVRGTTTMSQGTLRPALNRLERIHLIRRIDPTEPHPNPGKPRVTYRLTHTGQMILELHIDALKHMVRLANDRLPRS